MTEIGQGRLSCLLQSGCQWQGQIDPGAAVPLRAADCFFVGVLGIGNIGKQVAKRVQSFDAQVQYYDLYPLDEVVSENLGVTYVSLEELFRTSDIITCHTPLTKDTHHIVNAERLAMMKSSAILINTSRGPVVDEQA